GEGGAGHGDAHHGLASVFLGLFDGAGDFVGLAIAKAHLATAITDDDQGAEAEAATALDRGAGALHRDGSGLYLTDFVEQFCHWYCLFANGPGALSVSLELKSALTRCV